MEKGLGHLFSTSSSSHFFNKIKPVPNSISSMANFADNNASDVDCCRWVGLSSLFDYQVYLTIKLYQALNDAYWNY